MHSILFSFAGFLCAAIRLLIAATCTHLLACFCYSGSQLNAVRGQLGLQAPSDEGDEDSGDAGATGTAGNAGTDGTAGSLLEESSSAGQQQQPDVTAMARQVW